MTGSVPAVRIQVADEAGEWQSPAQQTPAILAALAAIGEDITRCSGSYEPRDLQQIREGLRTLDTRVTCQLDLRGIPARQTPELRFFTRDGLVEALRLRESPPPVPHGPLVVLEGDAAHEALADSVIKALDLTAQRGNAENRLAAAVEAITGTDADTAEGLAAEVLWILARLTREASGEPPPEFAGGQPVEFRDGTMTATWQPGTFVRQEGHRGVIDGPAGLRYLTDMDRLRSAPRPAGQVSAAGLSERETAALNALAEHDAPMQGGNLAGKMRAAGRETSPAAAHQAAAALARKGLAIKGIPDDGLHVRYEITNAGRELAARTRASRRLGDGASVIPDEDF